MGKKGKAVTVVGMLALLSTTLPGGLIGVESAWGEETGTLKLMVIDCFTEERIDGAETGVVIWREGAGEIDWASDRTDDGYVEFEFDCLEDGDEARVTVTPTDGSPDGDHTYYWLGGSMPQAPGSWDLAVGLDSVCEDGWWDKRQGIIECVYRDPKKP